MHCHAYRPYQPTRDGTFGPDQEPDHDLQISLTKIDGQWHVLATEPGHAEHVHRDGFRYFDDARDLRDQIRRGIANGHDLNLSYWDTRRI